MEAKKVAVVGGGLGGLATAALLARGGCAVTLYERSKHLGGRAQTTDVEGFRFNLGPHALYRAGAGMRVLGRLGVKPRGRVAGESGGSYALRAGRLHTLPRGPVSLLTTDVLQLSSKLEMARLLASLRRVDTEPLTHVPMRQWLDTRMSREDGRALVAALVRVATYASDLDALSAEAAVTQVQLAIEAGVLYLDDGWAALVDAVAAVAKASGATLELSARVEGVVVEQGQVRGLRLSDGSVCAADAVVLAGSPRDVASLLPEDAVLAKEAEGATPIRAATLELGLSRLPRSESLFALGVDGPWYASVHSAYARLGPEGGAMVHVMKYLSPSAPEATEAELEAVMDALQPGWREVLVARRFRPALVVSHWLPTASTGGLSGRPAPAVPHVAGLFRVGDWVGGEGMLSDASFASAESVERALLHHAEVAPRRLAVGA
ncbi:FAD-dependent oxidoreductase [Myxococcus sp. MISCRS1]|jgi:phytoene dehydrogenase-like protein|uniref:phytoene desaturase family protein n=1 Tax=Myxococcus sp. MISCRS1 TaxID=2996786 RepID=UPI002270D388|nr:FAD-dependent oxidoreductase [Myxococcus sp. MISCRS1]MCY0999428.1 FAD-dependent oxidoreductase [Myxococcus sp. MISCRS1]